ARARDSRTPSRARSPSPRRRGTSRSGRPASEDSRRCLDSPRTGATIRLLHATNGTRRRVVVTGLGLVTPLGTGVEKNWDALVASRSGIRRITRFDASVLPAQIAGEVPDFEPDRFLERKDLKKMDIFIQYAVAAAQMGMDDAGIP